MPSIKGGTVIAPKSKSEAHRFLIMAALADKMVCTESFAFCEDVEATASCIREIGSKIDYKNGLIKIFPNISGNPVDINCKNSASTFRFIMPVIAALGINAKVSADIDLRRRLNYTLYKILCEHGFLISSPNFPLYCGKKMHGGEYLIDSSMPSQDVTGLLIALPLLPENSTITVTEKAISKPYYISLTIDMLKKFGIEIENHGTTFYIRGNQEYISPGNLSIGGDWSLSAAWLCAGALSEKGITVQGLDVTSVQDDKKILEYIKQFGAEITYVDEYVSIRGKERKSFNVDVSLTPDLFPVLAVLASVAKGSSLFYNIKNLRINETNRLNTTVQMLIRLGASVKITGDSLEITGKPFLDGGAVTSSGDHRIAMAAAIAAQVCNNKVLLNGADAVKKSYPYFYRDYRKLGGEVYVHI